MTFALMSPGERNIHKYSVGKKDNEWILFGEKKNTKWEFIYVKPPQPAEGFKVVPLVLLGVL